MIENEKSSKNLSVKIQCSERQEEICFVWQKVNNSHKGEKQAGECVELEVN